MAVVASVGRGDMGRRFARGDGPVVAGRTGPRGRRMIKPHIGPAVGQVAVFADIRGRHVGWVFARGDRAVMTGHARTGDARMIEPDICPAIR